jgi:predicted metal-dependent hydrolase
MGIFYNEAPYNYVLSIEPNRPKSPIHGLCVYETKLCIVYEMDDFDVAFMVMLHELAHANIQHKTHSDTWEKEFVRLLKKHKISPVLVKSKWVGIYGPNLREYVGE